MSSIYANPLLGVIAFVLSPDRRLDYRHNLGSQRRQCRQGQYASGLARLEVSRIDLGRHTSDVSGPHRLGSGILL